jgi:hypothetical protein
VKGKGAKNANGECEQKSVDFLGAHARLGQIGETGGAPRVSRQLRHGNRGYDRTRSIGFFGKIIQNFGKLALKAEDHVDGLDAKTQTLSVRGGDRDVAVQSRNEIIEFLSITSRKALNQFDFLMDSAMQLTGHKTSHDN